MATTDQDEHPRSSWAELTARSVALCRRDPARWHACATRSDDLERQGVPALLAVQRALEESEAAASH